MYNCPATKAGVFALLLLLAALTARLALAQTGMGKIQGTVTDASNAVVPGAKVTITHTQTAGRRMCR